MGNWHSEPPGGTNIRARELGNMMDMVECLFSSLEVALSKIRGVHFHNHHFDHKLIIYSYYIILH